MNARDTQGTGAFTDLMPLANLGAHFAGSQALVLMNQQNEMRGGSDIPRSRWQSMLVEAGMTAGGISAAMSEESMKSLKYCLQWLQVSSGVHACIDWEGSLVRHPAHVFSSHPYPAQYATAHIEHHITILRDLMVKLNHGELDMSSTAVQNLTQIKGDVVHTIRDVVDVVGKYAGAALPEPARNSVKAFILSLPARWATVNRPAPNTVSSNYFGNSPASPSFSSAHLSAGPHAATHMQANRIMRRGASQGQLNAATTAQAANRVLTLAVESLDILRSVTVVFGESLDRAEIWVERLRVLGLQRKRQHDLAAEGDRIDALVGPFGQGGDDDERAHWEDARGTSSRSRHGSPGAESNVSMGSMKRRRVKGIASASHSPGSTVHSMRHSRTPDGGSDDEDLTETERTSAGRPALPLMFTPGSTGSTTGAQTGFSYSHSHSHNGASHNGSGPGAGTGTGAGAGRRKRNQGGKHTPHSHTPPHQSPLVISSRLSPPTTENGQTKNMAGGMQLDS